LEEENSIEIDYGSGDLAVANSFFWSSTKSINFKKVAKLWTDIWSFFHTFTILSDAGW